MTLVVPGEEYAEEIYSYRQEFIDRHDRLHGDHGLTGFENPREWITQCRLLTDKNTVPNPNWVEASQYMLVRRDDRRILGLINFRHLLNPYLAEFGGHIGYSVRPSERSKGYAKKMLSLCLEKCREFGLVKILISCDSNNAASRRTILACGGVFDRMTRDGDVILERYWIHLRKVKMIVTDLDRTLLRTDKTISDFTIDILNRCGERGIVIAYATGRSPFASKRFTDRFTPDIHITNDGAIATHHGKLLFQHFIPEDVVESILSVLADEPAVGQLTLTSDTGYYSSEPLDVTWSGWIDYSNAIHVDFSIPRDYGNVYKIVPNIVKTEIVEGIAASCPDVSILRFMEENWFHIKSKNASKEVAIQFVARHLNIGISDVVAFGDDFNDVGMLGLCGVGVAMENAVDEAKSAANTFCKSSDEDGVAIWLEEHVL